MINQNGAFDPLNRVGHEMGHIAEYVSKNQRSDLNPAAAWGYETVGARSVAMREAFASLVGVAAFYGENAVQPRTCTSAPPGPAKAQHCYSTVNTATYPYAGSDRNFETSLSGACIANHGRWEINNLRFYWDVIDSINDLQDSMNLAIWDVFDATAAWPCPGWPACYANGELHDMYSNVSNNLSSVTLVCQDCKNPWEFRNVVLNNYAGAFDIQDEYYNNCLHWF